MRTLISSAIGAALLAAFAALGSGLISGVYEQTKAPIAAAERAAEAKQLLDREFAKVPIEYHEAMWTNVGLNREILAAWHEHGEGKPS